ncbi:MAG: tetratricopeptide repeat protein [Phycisphaerae bacterium]
MSARRGVRYFESRHWDNIESTGSFHSPSIRAPRTTTSAITTSATAEAIPLYAAACQIDPTVRSAFASYFAAVSAVQGPAAVISGATPLLDAPNLDRNVRWTVLLARGNAYLRLGQRPAALDDYHAALSIVKPGSPAAGQINAALQRAGVPPAAPR